MDAHNPWGFFQTNHVMTFRIVLLCAITLFYYCLAIILFKRIPQRRQTSHRSLKYA